MIPSILQMHPGNDPFQLGMSMIPGVNAPLAPTQAAPAIPSILPPADAGTSPSPAQAPAGGGPMMGWGLPSQNPGAYGLMTPKQASWAAMASNIGNIVSSGGYYRPNLQDPTAAGQAAAVSILNADLQYQQQQIQRAQEERLQQQMVVEQEAAQVQREFLNSQAAQYPEGSPERAMILSGNIDEVYKRATRQEQARMEHDYRMAEIAARTRGQRAAEERFGVKPEYEVDAQGNVVAVQYGSSGTRIERRLDRRPFALETRTPEYQARVEEEKAAAKERGTERATKAIQAPESVRKADDALRVLDEAIADTEGRQRAVGVEANLPTLAGGRAADYEKRLEQIKGKVAVDAYESLRGGGHITERETEFATKARTDLDLTQSDEAHLQSLRDLRQIIAEGRARAEAIVNAGKPEQKQQPKVYRYNPQTGQLE